MDVNISYRPAEVFRRSFCPKGKCRKEEKKVLTKVGWCGSLSKLSRAVELKGRREMKKFWKAKNKA